MAGLLFIESLIFLLLTFFTCFAVGFPVGRLDGPNDQEAYTDVTYTERVTDWLPIPINGSVRVKGIDIPIATIIRVSGGCIGLIIIGVLALCIRFCNKHIKQLREAEEELRCIQVVVHGVKIQDPKELDSNEKGPSGNKEIEKDDSAIKTDPPHAICADKDEEESIETEWVDEDDEPENTSDQKNEEGAQNKNKGKNKRRNRKCKK